MYELKNINKKSLFYAFQTLALTLDQKGVLKLGELQAKLNLMTDNLSDAEDEITIQSLRSIANYFQPDGFHPSVHYGDQKDS